MKPILILIIFLSLISSSLKAQINNKAANKEDTTRSFSMIEDTLKYSKNLFQKHYLMPRFQLDNTKDPQLLPYNHFRKKLEVETINSGALIGAIAGGILGYSAGYLLGKSDYYDYNYPSFYRNSSSHHAFMGAINGTFIGTEFGNTLGEAFEGTSPFIIGFENDWDYYQWIQSQ